MVESKVISVGFGLIMAGAVYTGLNVRSLVQDDAQVTAKQDQIGQRECGASRPSLGQSTEDRSYGTMMFDRIAIETPKEPGEYLLIPITNFDINAIAAHRNAICWREVVGLNQPTPKGYEPQGLLGVVVMGIGIVGATEAYVRKVLRYRPQITKTQTV